LFISIPNAPPVGTKLNLAFGVPGGHVQADVEMAWDFAEAPCLDGLMGLFSAVSHPCDIIGFLVSSADFGISGRRLLWFWRRYAEVRGGRNRGAIVPLTLGDICC
jgi:hypothetical protein